jgi:hypothetical protein
MPQSRLGGRTAMPERTASQLKVMTPRGFPSVSPKKTAVATGSLRSAADISASSP